MSVTASTTTWSRHVRPGCRACTSWSVGVLHADDPAIELQVQSLMELPELLRTLR